MAYDVISPNDFGYFSRINPICYGPSIILRDYGSFSTRYNMPDLINIPVVAELKTNKMAYRHSMEVRDIAGNILVRRDSLADNTIYKVTLDLPFGCYTIEVTDIEDMGLSYWAYPEQGTGFFRLLDLDENVLKNFNSDFGRAIFYTYNVGEGFYIQDPGYDELVSIYPNPTDGVVYVDIKDLLGKVRVNIYDMQGRLIKQAEGEAGNSGTLVFDLSTYPSGLYLVEVVHSHVTLKKKIIKN